MKDGPTYARLLPTLVADVWDTYQTVVGLSDLKGHPRDTGRNARVTEFYLSGLLKPHYPVPALYYGPDNPQWHDFYRTFNARYK